MQINGDREKVRGKKLVGEKGMGRDCFMKMF
jgi:hypothetical protein